MDTDGIKRKVTADFTFLRESPTFEVLGLLLFGSVAKGESSDRSDIDLCVVAPVVRDHPAFFRWLLAHLKDNRYDLRIFELMPLYLQIEVIERGEALFARDLYELYEYFYPFRRLWDDQKRRQTLTEQEARELFAPRHSRVKRSEGKRRN
jgi:hypothetical protein